MLSIADGESDRGDAVLSRPPTVGAQYGWKRSQYKRYFTALCTGSIRVGGSMRTTLVCSHLHTAAPGRRRHT